MAQKQTLTINVHIAGVRETLAAFRELPKEANDQLRERSQRLAERIANRVRAAGEAEGAQAALVADTVKARRDRVPVIQVGGTRKLGRHRAPAYALLFASEFGMNQRTGWYGWPKYRQSLGMQYHEHTGRDGLWIFPTVEASEGEIGREWRAAADEIVAAFAGVTRG